MRHHLKNESLQILPWGRRSGLLLQIGLTEFLRDLWGHQTERDLEFEVKMEKEERNGRDR